MKLQTILAASSKTNGFLTIEALIACAVLGLIIPAALSLSWSTSGLLSAAGNKLATLVASSSIISDGAYQQTIAKSLVYEREFAGNICSVTPQSGAGFTGIDVSIPPFSFLQSNSSPDNAFVVAKNGFLYEAVDSATASDPDFYIIDVRKPESPIVVSSLNTGPGLNALVVAGHYIYAANNSSVSQLQVIDIVDRIHPILVAKLKLPLPTATSTAPNARTITYDGGRIFLGTEKWNGSEFAVIDVLNPLSPRYVGGYDTDTLVNSIYVNKITGYAYLADADTQQFRVLDIHDPSRVVELNYFSPSGSDILEGKTLASYDGTSTLLYLGRSGGGFNNTSQHELYSFNISTDPILASPVAHTDVPGGAYSISAHASYLFVATHAVTSPIQIWTSDLSRRIYSSGSILPISSLTMTTCDHGHLYAALSSTQGFGIITPH